MTCFLVVCFLYLLLVSSFVARSYSLNLSLAASSHLIVLLHSDHCRTLGTVGLRLENFFKYEKFLNRKCVSIICRS